MPVLVCLGVQWGDEGKGKIVDYLTESASLVVRFQGGANAGHTLVVDGKKTALRLTPSGILRPTSRCLLAAGVVIDPAVLKSEFESLRAAGVEINPRRIGIAAEAHLVLPYHQAIDEERENFLADAKIGTTKKGIGPAYEDLVARLGIRFSDLLNLAQLKILVERNVELKNRTLKSVFGSDKSFCAKEIFQSLLEYRELFSEYLTDVSSEILAAKEKNDLVIFEGAQASMLDIYHGNYPNVTSSNTLAGFACVSAGFAPSHINYVLGVCKAYATRVGSGPFPTEDLTNVGDTLRVAGKEFGTVTGRPRRCGHFDAVAASRAVKINGIDGLFVTKLDVLTGLDTVKLGVGYLIEGKKINHFPTSCDELAKVEIEWEEFPGWKEDLSEVKSLADLPKAASTFISRIAEVTKTPVIGFSVGPDREQTIVTSKQLQDLVSPKG